MAELELGVLGQVRLGHAVEHQSGVLVDDEGVAGGLQTGTLSCVAEGEAVLDLLNFEI